MIPKFRNNPQNGSSLPKLQFIEPCVSITFHETSQLCLYQAVVVQLFSIYDLEKNKPKIPLFFEIYMWDFGKHSIEGHEI